MATFYVIVLISDLNTDKKHTDLLHGTTDLSFIINYCLQIQSLCLWHWRYTWFSLHIHGGMTAWWLPWVFCISFKCWFWTSSRINATCMQHMKPTQKDWLENPLSNLGTGPGVKMHLGAHPSSNFFFISSYWISSHDTTQAWNYQKHAHIYFI